MSRFWSKVSFKIGVVMHFGGFFWPTSEICDTCMHSYWNQTHTQVWWLREAAQIGQMFIPLCEKHSAAEFQLIQQFWLQLDISFQVLRLHTTIENHL